MSSFESAVPASSAMSLQEPAFLDPARKHQGELSEQSQPFFQTQLWATFRLFAKPQQPWQLRQLLFSVHSTSCLHLFTNYCSPSADFLVCDKLKRNPRSIDVSGCNTVLHREKSRRKADNVMCSGRYRLHLNGSRSLIDKVGFCSHCLGKSWICLNFCICSAAWSTISMLNFVPTRGPNAKPTPSAI
jgi:hypothetical protein